MPVISNAGDQVPEYIPGTHVKNPAAVSLGRLGGRAGRGEAKRRSAAHHAKMVAAKKERRDCALEVLGALIECEDAISAFRDAYPLHHPTIELLIRAEHRAALAIERATGTKPGQLNDGQTKGQDGPR